MNKRFPDVGAMVLCGGESQRMGFDKWLLPVGDITLLKFVVAPLREYFGGVVISSGTQRLDSGFEDIGCVLDQNEACGPLEGIRAGLQYLASNFDIAYVTACDIPTFKPEVFQMLLQRLEKDVDAVIPVQSGDPERVFGMTALYRTAVHKKIDRLIRQRSLRVAQLAEKLATCKLDAESIRTVDPNLHSLRNINTPEEYLNWLPCIGEQCDSKTLKILRGSKNLRSGR